MSLVRPCQNLGTEVECAADLILEEPYRKNRSQPCKIFLHTVLSKDTTPTNDQNNAGDDDDDSLGLPSNFKYGTITVAKLELSKLTGKGKDAHPYVLCEFGEWGESTPTETKVVEGRCGWTQQQLNMTFDVSRYVNAMQYNTIQQYNR